MYFFISRGKITDEFKDSSKTHFTYKYFLNLCIIKVLLDATNYFSCIQLQSSSEAEKIAWDQLLSLTFALKQLSFFRI